MRASQIHPEELLDRIFKAWITDKIEELPPAEQKILERMEYADKKIRHGGKGSMYRNLLADMTQKFKEHEVTSRTLENDIQRAKRFFLSAYTREDKEYARGVHIEWLKRFIWKAEALDDFRSVAALMKEKSDVEALKTQDVILPDYSKLHRQPILVITNATELGVPEIENLEEELAKLRKPKTGLKFDSEEIEDAEIVKDDE